VLIFAPKRIAGGRSLAMELARRSDDGFVIENPRLSQPGQCGLGEELEFIRLTNEMLRRTQRIDCSGQTRAVRGGEGTHLEYECFVCARSVES